MDFRQGTIHTNQIIKTMENSEKFASLKRALKSKRISAILLIHSKSEGAFIRICIEEMNKYTKKYESIHIEYPINVVIFEGHTQGKPTKLEDLNRVCFYQPVYLSSHTLTILKAIKSDSHLTLKIVGFNGSNNTNAVNFVHHTAYLHINENPHLFSYYIGPDNLASPITY